MLLHWKVLLIVRHDYYSHYYDYYDSFPLPEQALQGSREIGSAEAAFRQRRRETEVAVALAERLDAAAGREEAWSEDQVGDTDEMWTRYVDEVYGARCGRDRRGSQRACRRARSGCGCSTPLEGATPRTPLLLPLGRPRQPRRGAFLLRTSRPPGSQGSASRPEFFLQNSGGPGGIQEHGPMRVLRKYT